MAAIKIGDTVIWGKNEWTVIGKRDNDDGFYSYGTMLALKSKDGSIVEGVDDYEVYVTK